MPDGSENTIDEYQPSLDEFDYEAELQRNRASQQATAGTEDQETEDGEETKSKLNFIEMMLVLMLAIGVDFGVGWTFGLLEGATLAIPIIGVPIATVIASVEKIITLITAMILWLWCLFRMKKFPWKRYVATTFIELMPALGEASPTWTIFICSIIFEEKILPIIQQKMETISKARAAAKTVKKIAKVAKTAAKVAAAA